MSVHNNEMLILQNIRDILYEKAVELWNRAEGLERQLKTRKIDSQDKKWKDLGEEAEKQQKDILSLKQRVEAAVELGEKRGKHMEHTQKIMEQLEHDVKILEGSNALLKEGLAKVAVSVSTVLPDKMPPPSSSPHI